MTNIWHIKTSQADRSVHIRPNENESRIFDIVRKARDMYMPGVTLRVAGGWVRDKLLGKDSDDIDIAVSGGDGVAVANAIGNYDRQNGLGRTGKAYELSLEKGGDSAGLKVGAIDVDGIKIDFVPLRTERYSAGSRVPIMVPTDDHTQDAVRRDLTINAMYYNIDTGEIEDPSNGMEDLRKGILRTPVDPIATLTEDPLRAVRALRFLSKMPGFTLDPSLEQAIANPDVHAAWERKVAPERVRKELEGIAKGSNPADAFKVMLQSDLYKPMFQSAKMTGFNPIGMDQNNPHHDLNLLNHTVEVVRNMNEIMKREGYGERERMLAVLAALFHDFGKMDPGIIQPSKTIPGASSYPGHEDVSADIAEEVLKRLGFGTERSLVAKIVKEHMRPHGSLETPKAVGRFVRDFTDMKIDDPMREQLPDITVLHSEADARAKGIGASPEELAEKNRIREKVQNYMMSSAQGSVKPLLSGKDLMTLFPNLNPKTGFIKKMTDTLNEVRDEGKISDAESAKAYLVSFYGSDGSGVTKSASSACGWYKKARTMKVDPEGDHDETGQAEGLFHRNNIRYGRQKDIRHVAIENGEVIGAVASGWENGSGQDHSDREDERVMIYSFDLVVDPKHRRKGVGKKLIDDAVLEYERDKLIYEEASGIHSMMRLWVINPALVPYLESIGFEVETSYEDGSAYLTKW
jgi:tRNA nucleotidyltransferase (CCA-adding enzyme)